MLFGISGRKSSGKTTLSNLILKRGFKKASFATGLKEYLCKLYEWDESDLNTQEGKESLLPQPVVWDKETCEKLSKIIDDPSLKFEDFQEFKTRRHAMQYIGTEVLRKHNQDFHLNEFKKRYSNGNFVCDDMRFPNEVNLIKKMGGTCYFIVRPYNWDYSNHASEISLSYRDFDNIILNDCSLKNLTKSFEKITSNAIAMNNIGKIQKMNLNITDDKTIFSEPNETNSYWAGFLSAQESYEIQPNGSYILKIISRNVGLINSFLKFSKAKEELNLNLQAADQIYCTTITSPYIIEDLKLWEMKPGIGKASKVPDLIKNNEDYSKQWLSGLLDGSANNSLNYKK